MDEHMKEYLVGKLERHASEMADLLKQMRDEAPESRLIKLELQLIAYGRGVKIGLTVDGCPNLPGVGELERELGLVEGPEEPK